MAAVVLQQAAQRPNIHMHNGRDVADTESVGFIMAGDLIRDQDIAREILDGATPVSKTDDGRTIIQDKLGGFWFVHEEVDPPAPPAPVLGSVTATSPQRIIDEPEPAPLTRQDIANGLRTDPVSPGDPEGRVQRLEAEVSELVAETRRLRAIVDLLLQAR